MGALSSDEVTRSTETATNNTGNRGKTFGETVVAYFANLSWNLTGGTEEKYENALTE